MKKQYYLLNKNIILCIIVYYEVACEIYPLYVLCITVVFLAYSNRYNGSYDHLYNRSIFV